MAMNAGTILFRVIGLLCVGTAVILSSCGKPYTYVSSTSYYPTNADRSSAEYTLVVQADGAPGKAYSDFSDKVVHFVLFQKGEELAKQMQTIKAGRLDWNVRWDDATLVRVVFTERDSRTNELHAITLRFDPIRKQLSTSN